MGRSGGARRRSSIVNRSGADTLVSFFVDALSLFVFGPLAFRDLARLEAQCTIVAFAQHRKEQKGKERLGA